MIKIVEGDILQATESIIGHQVNCQGVMGAGLAKQIRVMYPIVFNGYKNYCNNRHPYDLLGEVQLIQVSNEKYIANIFAQLNYGRKKLIYTDYESLSKGMNYLKDLARKYDKSITLPYGIGCGLAGGDWNVVHKLIQEVFEDYEVTLYKFK
ncbi:macro domain-containing protein [Cytobacillus praedii]|uniref:Appr-1-p processing protein n=1 Tax=Cytobacillus praedii TaxID=1742358 RepID=A0A4R1AUS9_9BACI|nr:macro domain-containing protein [Cytobacillus praedii]TCJ01149.1 Appr-1-p processing protein [Cytobacillus praedii]